jgi:Beta-ketoacyl synthase, N-terminal domain
MPSSAHLPGPPAAPIPAPGPGEAFRFPFRIADWTAYAGPGLSDKEAWRSWAGSAPLDWSPPETPPAPVAAMPPILRRRADAADRLALEAAFRLAPAGGLPSVFASRHGQVVRSVAMLRAQAAGEPASPMDFSLSVHNATAGQYSIAAGDRHASTSLSSRGESFGSALLEAAGLLAEGAPEVLVISSDPRLPDALGPLSDPEPSGYAFGLRLCADGGSAWTCALASAPGPDHAEPQAFAFLRALAGGRPRAEWSRGSRLWSWERA